MNEEYINTLKTLDAIEEYRKKVNEACDKRSERVKLLTKGFELSQMPFGYIKECFENFAPVLFNTKEGRKLIKKYTNEVKNNYTLNTLHTIYENIRKTSKDSDVDFLINSIVNENVNLSQKTVKTVTESLGKILAEAYLYIGKEANELIPEEKQNLDNAIKYITENKKHIKELFFTLFIEGIQDKSIEIDDEEVFSFDTNYEIKMRLMELSTGRCMDLDKFETKEKFEKISKKIENIDVFRFTHICFFEDLDLPDDYTEGDFVIEILVRKISETEEKEYTVQTLYILNVE